MSATNKLVSPATASDLELSIAQSLYDLETSVADLKADLRPLQFSAAKEVRFNDSFGAGWRRCCRSEELD